MPLPKKMTDDRLNSILLDLLTECEELELYLYNNFDEHFDSDESKRLTEQARELFASACVLTDEIIELYTDKKKEEN